MRKFKIPHGEVIKIHIPLSNMRNNPRIAYFLTNLDSLGLGFKFKKVVSGKQIVWIYPLGG